MRSDLALTSPPPLQHDVLFLELPVYDPLKLFAVLKGVPDEALEQVIESSIAEVGLSEKTHVLARALSGGMKRKLCLAMAFM